MSKYLFIILWFFPVYGDIKGAGSSYSAPLYLKLAQDYNKDKGAHINYISSGSVKGMESLLKEEVDFAASELPLSKEDLTEKDLIQFPGNISGIAIIINIEGVKDKIKLTHQLLSDIFLGKITKWNDPQIQSLNTNVSLPNADINIIHREDESGTTYVFSIYLAQIDPFWKKKYKGPSTLVNWPKGVGVKGNNGITQAVRETKNSIGYTQFSYVSNINVVLLKNKDGNFVEPSIKTIQSAVLNANWTQAPSGFSLSIINQPGKDSWPITAASYVFLKKNNKNNQEILNFFKWCFKNGEKTMISLGYIPMIKNYAEIIESTLKE